MLVTVECLFIGINLFNSLTSRLLFGFSTCFKRENKKRNCRVIFEFRVYFPLRKPSHTNPSDISFSRSIASVASVIMQMKIRENSNFKKKSSF